MRARTGAGATTRTRRHSDDAGTRERGWEGQGWRKCLAPGTRKAARNRAAPYQSLGQPRKAQVSSTISKGAGLQSRPKATGHEAVMGLGGSINAIAKKLYQWAQPPKQTLLLLRCLNSGQS